MNNKVILGKEDIDLQEFKGKMVYDDTDSLVSYTERAEKERKGAEVESIEIESYGSPTRNSMHKVKDMIQKEFEINTIVLIHRIGHFEPGDTIKAVLISAPEKEVALKALAMTIDMVESHVPIKKRVSTTDGRDYWVKRADEVMNLYGQVVEGIFEEE